MASETAGRAPPGPIQTFVFVDLETTGLSQLDRITELSCIAVLRDELLCGPERRPRVLNKLTVCLNPRRQIDAFIEGLTGLSNCYLHPLRPFDADLVALLSLFLGRLPPPTCLVAHNGIAFDFPRLLSEAGAASGDRLLPQELLCADSLPLMRHLEPQGEDGVPPRSYKLAEVFRRRTGRSPSQSHCAEDDCVTLLALVQLEADRALQWLQENATPLAEVGAASKGEQGDL